jgi:hypothetical protein
MATNPYFNFYTNTSEQSLTNDLVVESIQIFGQDIRYIPREYAYVDDVFNEVRNSTFTTEFTIEAYISGVDGFQGDGDLLSKFGVEVRDSQDFIVATSRFSTEATTAGLDFTKPREGDLIYFPLTDYLMQIMQVEDEEVYYQIGRTYILRLTCETFEPNGEVINTGIEEIDDNVSRYQYTVQLTLADGSGNYTVGEEVYQGLSLEDFTAKAVVSDWNPTDSILTIQTINGNFNSGGTVTGNASGAVYVLGVKETMIFPDVIGDADNKTYQTQADSIIDFSEDNPFSEEY